MVGLAGSGRGEVVAMENGLTPPAGDLMELKVDLLIAAASAGVLLYSGRLLAPTARLRPGGHHRVQTLSSGRQRFHDRA